MVHEGQRGVYRRWMAIFTLSIAVALVGCGPRGEREETAPKPAAQQQEAAPPAEPRPPQVSIGIYQKSNGNYDVDVPQVRITRGATPHVATGIVWHNPFSKDLYIYFKASPLVPPGAITVPAKKKSVVAHPAPNAQDGTYQYWVVDNPNPTQLPDDGSVEIIP